MVHFSGWSSLWCIMLLQLMSKIDQVHILCGESLLECLKSFHSFLGELTGFVQKDYGWLQGGTFQEERCAACAWHGRPLNVIFTDKCWKCASRVQGISRRPRRGRCVTRITFHFSCLPLAKQQFHLKGKLKLTVFFQASKVNEENRQAWKILTGGNFQIGLELEQAV